MIKNLIVVIAMISYGLLIIGCYKIMKSTEPLDLLSILVISTAGFITCGILNGIEATKKP